MPMSKEDKQKALNYLDAEIKKGIEKTRKNYMNIPIDKSITKRRKRLVKRILHNI